ncbi:hypothetical protein [Actinocorallia libanotica]|uniref:Uncharacterized protein n=1 Tax=Actinocorallia libanotica TaxID=46162 RepID=A0ABN1RZI0_9ACTN
MATIVNGGSDSAVAGALCTPTTARSSGATDLWQRNPASPLFHANAVHVTG